MDLSSEFYGIADPFKFVANALNDELRSRGAHLRPDRYEDAAGYLLEVLVRLRGIFDPQRARRQSFSTFAYDILRRRYTSWLRKANGDSRYGIWVGGDPRARVWIGGDADCAHEELVKPGRPRRARPRCRCGARLECRHEPLTENGVQVHPRRCRSCGAEWVGNDGREQATADVDALRAHASIDATSFLALVRELDHDKLSPRARGALNRIVVLMGAGLNAGQAAEQLGKTRREVRKDLDRLRKELAA